MQDAHNLLRPETLESLFVLWRVTRRQEYREQVPLSLWLVHDSVSQQLPVSHILETLFVLWRITRPPG